MAIVTIADSLQIRYNHSMRRLLAAAALCILPISLLRAVDEDFLAKLDQALVDVHSKVSPSVVVVTVERDPKTIDGLPREIERLLESPETGGIVVPSEQGSGFIIDPDGYIMTNKHVIANSVSGGIKVRLADKREYRAKLVGYDGDTDIALLKIDAVGLVPIEIGDSSKVRVGQLVCALGAPYKLQDTFTVGVVSAVGRTDLTDAAHYEEYIQTDAAIHPGNSGGPLCDSRGRVIAVNTMVNGINRGLGFAVPMNVASETARQIRETGSVERPWLGIEIATLRADSAYAKYFAPLKEAALVAGLRPGSPAFSRGLRAGDAIVELDGVSIPNTRELQRMILGKEIGDTVDLGIVRNGKSSQVTIPLLSKPVEALPGVAAALPPRPPVIVEELKLPFGLEFSSNEGSLTVESVSPHSLAALANVQPGDIILAVEGNKVKTGADVMKIVQDSDMARGVMLLVDRGGREGFVIVSK